jgi:hypothetical protein
VSIVRDYNFSLGGVEFGIREPITVESFDPGAASWRTQDATNPLGDGTIFGMDYIDPPVWAFELSTYDTIEAGPALAAIAPLAQKWRGVGLTDTLGRVTPLTYRLAGRQRRVYGRPRRWQAAMDNRLLTGYVAVNADFQCADHLHYDELELSTNVDMVPAYRGGVVTPLITPMTTVAGGHRDGFVTVGGDTPTRDITIRINGPITNPWVDTGGFRLQLNLSLLSGQYVVIRPQPWEMTIMRNGVGSVAGALSKGARLSDIALHPGTTEITFGGIDPTASSSCTISWRAAWITL